MPLAQDQRATLSILGYLFYRMGRLDSAAKVFAALIALAPAEARRACATLAAIEVERGRGQEALPLLRRVTEGRVLPSREAVLHLLRARALWQQERREEARAAVDDYLYLAGGRALLAASGKGNPA
ncbi:hypothetical protein [uncultured Bilophila sp.]|uniref:type III secretion apparatus assembly chaperone SctY n=1 Tax=uncultured Bilophila sp. TaxID=529385 RepID=UPI00262D0B07|nr:hypothetical protein [uncultured Bilophila sp.]